MGLLFLLSAGLGSAHAWTVNTNQNGLPLNWPAGQVGWTLNANGNHALDPQRLQTAMEEAAGQWNDIEDSNIDLTYLGPTATEAIDYTDNQNVIYFEDDWELDESLLAVTYVWSLDDGTIMAFDMAVNTSDHVWGTDGSADVNDLHNTITHEFGHAVGLAHSDIADASMYESTHEGETTKRDITTDDEHGMRYLYGSTVYQMEQSAPAAVGCTISGPTGIRGAVGVGLLLLPAICVLRRA